MEQRVERILPIKFSFFLNQKSIIQIQQQAMDLQKATVHMMKREEAGAVLMRMRWGPGDIIMIQMQSIQSTMEMFGGGSAPRAMIVVVRPE